MSKALELAQKLADMTSKHKAPSHERGVLNGAVEELRRLAQVEAEHAALLKAISDAEPVAQWLVETEDGIPMFDCDPPTAYEISLGWAPLYTLNGIKKP